MPWKEMVGIRNKVVHEYFDVNFDIIWKTAKEDIPTLEKKVEKILEELNSGQLRLG